MKRWLNLIVLLLAASAFGYAPQRRFTITAQSLSGSNVTSTLTVSLPPSVTLLYDSNGNLTNDGSRSFAYDAENRLVTNWVAGSWKSEFVYDGLGRRRIERDYAWQNGWVKTNETRNICDGYLPIQERDSNNVVRVTYTRGVDLSASLTGAGGIGGLLARTDTNSSTFYHADGNGNITALMDGNQNIAARYMYGPYAKLTGQWGPLAGVNAMQFSSMPRHANSGLSLYPFRGYDPSLQRWLSHDPIGERGGINLYGFVGNNPLTFLDPRGLDIDRGGGGAMGELAIGAVQGVFDLLDWVSDKLGVTGVLGASPSEVAAGLNPMMAYEAQLLRAEGAAASTGNSAQRAGPLLTKAAKCTANTAPKVLTDISHMGCLPTTGVGCFCDNLPAP